MNDMGRFADHRTPATSRLALLWGSYRAALERHPVAAAFVTVVLPLLAVACGFGVAAWIGVTGWTKYLFLLVGTVLVAFQYAAYANLRHVRGREWFSHLVLVITLTNVNAVSVAGGMVAMNPDGFGRYMIARELIPVMASAEQAADNLTVAATHIDEMAEYSVAQRKREMGDGVEYAPTCPASTGRGDGDISKWRKSSADAATALATRVRSGVTNARTAANAAQARGHAYRLVSHDTDMAEIASQVGAARAAVISADLASARASLLELAESVSPEGACPDASLAALINTAIADTNRTITIPSFVAPPRPTEQEAVNDILTQIGKVFGGQPDFGPYWPYMILSVILDGLAMSMLKSALGPKRRLTILDKIARKLGPEVDPAHLGQAMNDVAASSAWQQINANVTRERTRFGKAIHKMIVGSDDHAQGIFLRWLKQAGCVRSATIIGDKTHYVLHPKTLDRWFEDLLREWFRRNPAPRNARFATSGGWP